MSDCSVRLLSFSGGASRVLGLFATLKECNSTRLGFLSSHTHLLCLTSDGIRDRTELGWSGEHPVIEHRLHLSRVHGDEELEDSWYPAYAGLRPRFLNPVHLTEAPDVPTVGRKVRRSNSSAARPITSALSAGMSMVRTYSTADTRRLFALPLFRARFRGSAPRVLNLT